MEEKKPVNVRLSTAVLIVIIVALIGGLVFLAYQNVVLKNKQDESKTELQELQNKRTQELQDLQNKTQELQKTIDDAKNTLSNSTANNAQTNTAKESNTTTKENKYKEITKAIGEDVLYVTDVEKNNNKYTLKGVIYTRYKFTKEELNNIISEGQLKVGGKVYKVEKCKNKDDIDMDILYALKSGKDTFAYIGKYYTEDLDDEILYTLRSKGQIDPYWKLTTDYRKITIDGNVPVYFDFDEEYEDGKMTVKKEFANFKKADINPNEINPLTYSFKFKNGKCIEVYKTVQGI